MNIILKNMIMQEYNELDQQYMAGQLNQVGFYRSKAMLFQKYMHNKEEIIAVMTETSRCYLEGLLTCFQIHDDPLWISCYECQKDYAYDCLLKKLNHFNL